MQIEELVSKYHWLKIGDDGVLEMYLDHHALSSFRMCEGYFELSIMANIRAVSRSWNLEFGIIFHKMVELFYIDKKADVFELNTWLSKGIELWRLSRMDEFETHKMYKVLGGAYGFIAMMGQYANHFANEVDRLRVIGIEITFGKKKECVLGSFEVEGAYETTDSVRCYLTGRIDFLMDSGSAIGPLDHKTTAFFKGNPSESYDPQEGMTGYVFAAQHIIKHSFPELMQNRKVDRIWMNFAQVTPDADAMKRFRRVPLYKTEYQLEEYRKRQLRTFHKIYDMLVLGERPDWNTSTCNNMFFSPCPYKELHSQNNGSNMLTILNNNFVVSKEWNPENLD